MDNKKILLGLIGVGALAGLYFWNKNRKNGTNVVADMITDTPPTTNPVFSTEVTDKLAKQYADEMVTELDKEINYLTLNPVNNGLPSQLEAMKKLKNNYGNIYLMFKKSIPNFKNTEDLNTAKNLLIKIFVYGDKGIIDGRATISKDEQIWMANNQNLGETFGFDTSPIESGRNKSQFITDNIQIQNKLVSGGLTPKI